MGRAREEALEEFLYPATCPRCGSRMFVKEACCSFADQGFKTILRCIRADCPYKIGHERREKEEGQSQ